MARQIRIEFPGAIYHVMNRGDRREKIFESDYDLQVFLETLKDCCGKTKWAIHAYCLMKNHFHLVVETLHPNLVVGMQWMLSTFTLRMNARKKIPGHLFAGRYKAILVDPEDVSYFRTVCEYVHLNPCRSRALPANAPLSSFRWSSYPLYIGDPQKRPAWLRVDRVLGGYGIQKDSKSGRELFAITMEKRRETARMTDYNPGRVGWMYGNEAFKKNLLKQIAEEKGEIRTHGVLERITEQERSEKLFAEELEKHHLKEKNLGQLPKTCPEKISIARAMRQKSTVTTKWLCERLKMGAHGTLRNILSRESKMTK